MKRKHTPGPLIAYKSAMGTYGVAPYLENEPVTGFATATCHVQPFHPDGLDAAIHESKCNAMLYAASPDVTAALEALLDWCAGGDIPAELEQAGRDALAKVGP